MEGTDRVHQGAKGERTRGDGYAPPEDPNQPGREGRGREGGTQKKDWEPGDAGGNAARKRLEKMGIPRKVGKMDRIKLVINFLRNILFFC